MELTRKRRSEWIKQDPSPPLPEILDKFPHLQRSRWVIYVCCKVILLLFYCIQLRKEFKVIVSLDEVSTVIDSWIDYKEKLIKLAKIESATRPVLKKLLRSLPECEDLTSPNGEFYGWSNSYVVYRGVYSVSAMISFAA